MHCHQVLDWWWPKFSRLVQPVFFSISGDRNSIDVFNLFSPSIVFNCCIVIKVFDQWQPKFNWLAHPCLFIYLVVALWPRFWTNGDQMSCSPKWRLKFGWLLHPFFLLLLLFLFFIIIFIFFIDCCIVTKLLDQWLLKFGQPMHLFLFPLGHWLAIKVLGLVIVENFNCKSEPKFCQLIHVLYYWSLH